MQSFIEARSRITVSPPGENQILKNRTAGKQETKVDIKMSYPGFAYVDEGDGGLYEDDAKTSAVEEKGTEGCEHCPLCPCNPPYEKEGEEKVESQKPGWYKRIEQWARDLN